MVWPATGSELGILDYCGFPKDEAYYLKAAWTDQPVLHIFPHWNLKGQEGQEVEVWAYTNMDEVELLQDGKSLGRQKAEKDGHLVWKTIYQPGRLVAYGYQNGKKMLTERVETTGSAEKISVTTNKKTLRQNGEDIVVIDITLQDKKGRYVPDACDKIFVAVRGHGEILGWGNGDPGFKAEERLLGPDKREASFNAFMGNAQVIIRSLDSERKAVMPTVVFIRLKDGKETSITLPQP